MQRVEEKNLSAEIFKKPSVDRVITSFVVVFGFLSNLKANKAMLPYFIRKIIVQTHAIKNASRKLNENEKKQNKFDDDDD